ncbi:zinc finger protein 658B-like [Chrysoperla carnea]|uniref:zinc finger protein 658B-like n=1 Tax=Chrysoperla carnea TaxID=189513 RepID=UPI001D05F95E|nr:zinc finger protein 658B-like [Chrysoperla carnea]
MEIELYSVNDLQKLCRLCMETGSELYSIYDLTPLNEVGVHMQFLEMIMECTSLNIESGDGLPESICMECINYLSTTFSFKQRCERSDKKLKELVSFFNENKKDDELTLHLSVCQAKNINCGVCSKYFSSTTLLKSHLKNIHSIEINDEDISNIHTCDICDAMFFDQDKFLYHYQNHIDMATYYRNESDDHSLICYYCNVHFANVTDLENHIQIHKDDQTIFSCQLCDFKNTDNESVKTHLGKSHGVNHLVCNLCLLTFVSDRKFRSHVKTHKFINKLNYLCHICDGNFSTREAIRQHIIIHAKDIKTCKKCLKSFKNLTDYEAHVKEHVNKPALCTVCGKLFTNKHFLESHMLLHDGIKPFSCNICEKSFRTKSILINHQLTHSDIKPFACEVCEYSSRRLADLQMHLRVHTGDRPYSCTFPGCSMKFKTSSLQHQHARSHTGSEEMFTCEVCNKTIAKRSFKQHKFIHTNQRPHKCDICNKSFRRRNHLNIHKARVHPE